MGKREHGSESSTMIGEVAEAHQQAIERIRQDLDRLELVVMASCLRAHKDTEGSVDHRECVRDNPARETQASS